MVGVLDLSLGRRSLVSHRAYPLVVPPELSARIQSECGRKVRNGLIPHRAVKPVLHRFMNEPSFCERVHAISRELHDVVFDPDSREWGTWPTDLQEIIAVGFVVGVYLENGIDEMLLRLSEEELSFALRKWRTRCQIELPPRGYWNTPPRRAKFLERAYRSHKGDTAVIPIPTEVA